MKKQNSIYTLLIALLCFVSSCDYLGVSDQLAGGLQNTEQVFDNVSYTKRWYANVFAGIPDYSGINSVNVGAFKNPWTGMCDELVVGMETLPNTIIRIEMLPTWVFIVMVTVTNTFVRLIFFCRKHIR
jgi:phage terminase large subunit